MGHKKARNDGSKDSFCFLLKELLSLHIHSCEVGGLNKRVLPDIHNLRKADDTYGTCDLLGHFVYNNMIYLRGLVHSRRLILNRSSPIMDSQGEHHNHILLQSYSRSFLLHL
jgi:hypothetical protein